MKTGRAVFAAIGLGACLAAPAQAHPHVYVDVGTTLNFTDGKVTALGVAWTFDPFFSDSLKADYDANGDGLFDLKEKAKMVEHLAPNMKQTGYLTYLQAGGKAVEFTDMTNFDAKIGPDGVTYLFTLVLPRPIDPVAETVSWSTYDETFYVDMAPAETDPVAYRGLDGLKCGHVMDEDKEKPIFYGMVFPKRLTLNCARAES